MAPKEISHLAFTFKIKPRTAPMSCSLLRTPEVLYDCVKAMVTAAEGTGPVSVKMRSGFEDTSRFEENLLAAQVN